ncbi:polysaccharide pyruvyl transferase family protein [Pseudolysinimonas sp.]|jgi:colanic acid/amylovoran biosynthesis protein|uniref:polysaccharide pyruvyl transferase family protein n=1 Tax=Pseudolysinimonas sp. TaxID=2680009 RepID=UPI00378482FA
MPTASHPENHRNGHEFRAWVTSAVRLFGQTLLARIGFLRAGSARARTVVLASNGDANIGDVALLEAFVSTVGGPVLVIARDPASYPFIADLGSRVEVERTSMIWGSRVHRIRSFVRFGAALRGARAFVVIGADNMDGGYGDHFAVTEWASAIIARRLGVPSRIAGFSWSAEPSSAAVRALHRAARAGVELFPREHLSADRLPEPSRGSAVVTADLAFLLAEPVPDERWTPHVADLRERGATVCLLNVSALIASRVDLAADYRAIVAGLVAEGHHVVVVPHVGGHGNDDRTAARVALGVQGDSADITFVEDLLAPREIKALAAEADLVVTGRMHLSVLAMSVGTPAIVFATQGKVEGLLGHFGLAKFALVPSPGLAVRVLELAGDRPRLARARAEISAALPRVRRLAAQNLAGLPLQGVGADHATAGTGRA